MADPIMKIYKYEIIIGETSFHRIPKGGKVLSVQMQFDRLCFWVLVDANQTELVGRSFEIFGTGHPIENISKLTYIDTFQINTFVGHLFEREV